MLASEFVTAVYLKAERKIPTFLSGSSKWNTILAIGNSKIDAWMTEPDANWDSLYDSIYPIGTVSATNTFELDDEVRILSPAPGDYVIITHTDGTISEYETVKAKDLKRYATGNYCAKVGRNLVFSRAFTTSDTESGGTITAPVYRYAEHLINDNDEVPVDDPNWLVLATAAEYNRGDIVKQNQYPNIINEANALMEAMKISNEAQVEDAPRPWNPGGATW